MREAAELTDHLPVLDRVVVISFVAEESKKLDCAILVFKRFRMLEGQIQEAPLMQTGARIDTFVNCQPRLPQRDPICCERQRCAPIDIARKLVEHDDGREMPLA